MDKKLINGLNKRYATKKFDASKKISDQDLNAILEALRLTPTSFGLQLMKVVVVENEEKRNELFAQSFQQEQVVTASHLLVLCREDIVDQAHLDTYITRVANTREQKEEDLEGFKNMLKQYVLSMSNQEQCLWMDKQVYIALGNMLTVCALLEIDACPMEGFVADAYNKILNLSEKGLHATLVVPIGYRSHEDTNALAKKVRRSTNEFVVKI